MKMIIHQVTQGSSEWLALRANHFCASDAPAMMGVSPYKTRNQLLAEFSGAKPEVSEFQQKLFDKGHAAEAAARIIIEARIGQELCPVTATRGRLLASSDGVTVVDDVGFEHKLYNADLAAAVDAGIVPDAYIWQLEQQAYVLGLEKIIFAVSDGTEATLRTVDYIPDPAKQAKLIAGWEQFEKDLADFNPVAGLAEVKAAPIESLPVPFVEIVGKVTKTNLADFKRIALERIGAVKTDLVTDTDFAEAAAMVKFLDDGEKRIDIVKEQALGQAASIQELFTTLDDIKAQMRAKRLEVDKLVKRRQEERRVEIVATGRAGFNQHISQLNERLGRMIMTRQTFPEPNFVEAIKGKRNFQSMQDAVDAMLANAKLEANAIADKVDLNLKHYAAEAAGYEGLFRDLDALLFKPADDFALVVKTRIADHKAAEQKRLDDERERIRREEEARAAAKVEAETRAQVAAQAAAAAPAPIPQPQSAAVSTSPRNIVPMARAEARPSDESIIAALALHYRVHESKAIQWLLAMDLDVASKRMASEFDAA